MRGVQLQELSFLVIELKLIGCQPTIDHVLKHQYGGRDVI